MSMSKRNSIYLTKCILLGTGYFCEKTIPEAKDLIDRKVQLISKSIESIESVGINKKKNLSQLTQIIQYKIAQSN